MNGASGGRRDRRRVRNLVPAVALVAACVTVLGLGACTPDSELSDPELFSKYCSKCHGEDGSGNESLLAGGHEVDLLTSRWIARGDRERIYRRIAYGYGQMPAYIDEVDPETLERLVELTLRLRDEGLEAKSGQDREDTSGDNRKDQRDDDSEDESEDDDHGSTEAESRLPESRSAG